ncbi:MAG TPA: MoaD/ThiS family protein [Dehalococcoidia bacterium]
MVKPAMTVTLKLFGDLRKYSGRNAPDKTTVTLAEGATISDLARQLGMTADDEIIAGVNGEQAQNDTVLTDGDEILLVSPMEGGR